MTKVVFTPKGGNWDVLNPVLNNSSELQKLKDSLTDDIVFSLQNNISYSAGISDNVNDYQLRNIRVDHAEPNGKNGLKMNFISIPSLGYEMQYSVLSRAIDDHAE